MIKTKLRIKANIPEKQFIESLLNQKYSGQDMQDILLIFSLYALVHSWKANKVIYYLNLLK